MRALGASQRNTVSKLDFKEFESKVNEPCGRYFSFPIIFFLQSNFYLSERVVADTEKI